MGAPLIQRALADEDAVRDFGFTVIPFAEVERAQRFVEQKLRGVPASDGVQRIGELKDLVFLHELREYLATLRPSTPQEVAKLQTLLNATTTRIRELKAEKELQSRREQRRSRAARRRKKAEAGSAVPEGVNTGQVRSFAEAVSRLEFAREQATKETPDYTVAAEAVQQVVAWIESVRNEENLREHFPVPSTRDRVAGILWNTHAINSVLQRMRIGAPAKGLWASAFESLTAAGPFLRELSGDTTESDREVVADVEWATSPEVGWATAGLFAGAVSVVIAAGALGTLVTAHGLASGLVGRLAGAISQRPEFWYEVFNVVLGTGIVVVAAGPEEFVKSVATPEGAAQTAYQVIALILLRRTSVPGSPGTRSEGKKPGASPTLESSRELESTAKRLGSTSPEGLGASAGPEGVALHPRGNAPKVETLRPGSQRPIPVASAEPSATRLLRQSGGRLRDPKGGLNELFRRLGEKSASTRIGAEGEFRQLRNLIDDPNVADIEYIKSSSAGPSTDVKVTYNSGQVEHIEFRTTTSTKQKTLTLTIQQKVTTSSGASRKDTQFPEKGGRASFEFARATREQAIKTIEEVNRLNKRPSKLKQTIDPNVESITIKVRSGDFEETLHWRQIDGEFVLAE